MEKKSKKIIKPDIPGGFIDYLPGDFRARQRILETIFRVFSSYAYDSIETPMVEFVHVLSGEDETSKNIFHLFKRGRRSSDQPIGLRFDHTVPLARFLAAHPYNPQTKEGIRLPFRRMVLGPVFRADEPQKGRYRQFYQFDADIIGSPDMIADTEIIALINHSLTALGLDRFVIRLNNRKILNGLADIIQLRDRLNFSREDLLHEIFRILDKADKIGQTAVIEALLARPVDEKDPAPNLSPAAVEKIVFLLNINGSNQAKLVSAQRLFSNSEIAQEGIKELQDILTLSYHLNIPENRLIVDFTVARGLDYYTGPVMETILLDAPEFGSVFSGGRYNRLMERFTGQEMPAVGASLGVDRFFAALRQLGKFTSGADSGVEVVILRISPDLDIHYLGIAKAIRDQGMSVEVCLIKDTTFKAQFNYALSRQAKFAVIFGNDEFERQEVQIKNLLTREQLSLSYNQLAAYFTNNQSK